MKQNNRYLFAILLAVFMLALAACGAGKPEDQGPEAKPTDETGAGANAQFPMTIETKKGKTVLSAMPKKVAFFDLGALDALHAVGVEAAGLPKKAVPAYLKKFQDSKYADLGSLVEPDFEALSAMKPDLIIVSGRQEDMYDKFQEIAPTLFIQLDTHNYMASYRDNLEQLASIFGKTEEMKEQLAQIDSSVKELREKATAAGQTASVLLGSEGKVSAYGPGSRFGLIYDVFGFQPIDTDLQESRHGQDVSFEYVLDKNPDVIFVIDRDKAFNPEMSAKTFFENELVKKTKAYQGGKIVYLDAAYWYLASGGVQSMKEMVKEVKAAL